MAEHDTNEPMTSESKMNDRLAAPAGDLREFASSEELERTAPGDADTPEKDETASEAENPENLHGSLHGNWNRTDQS